MVAEFDALLLTDDRRKLVPHHVIVLNDCILVTQPPHASDGTLDCVFFWLVGNLTLAQPIDMLQWNLPQPIYTRLSTATYLQTPYELIVFVHDNVEERDRCATILKDVFDRATRLLS
jgi:hypothetical protein